MSNTAIVFSQELRRLSAGFEQSIVCLYDVWETGKGVPEVDEALQRRSIIGGSCNGSHKIAAESVDGAEHVSWFAGSGGAEAMHRAFVVYDKHFHRSIWE